MRRPRNVRWMWAFLVAALAGLPPIALSAHATGAPVSPSSPFGPFPSGLDRTPIHSGTGAIQLVAPGFSPPTGVTAIGPLPAAVNVTVVVGLPLTDSNALAGLISAMYTPGTPEYREFRSASELAASFGPTADMLSRARSYFASFGLSAVPSPDHLFLTVSGSSERVATAFSTSFEQYRAPGGRVFFSHPTSASLPGGLAVAGVYGLGNATPLEPDIGGPLTVRGPVTPDASCTGNGGLLTACQIWQAYNMTTLVSSGMDGAGETVAVIDPYSSGEGQSSLASDLALFAAQSQISAGTVNFVYPDPPPGNLNVSSNPRWALEDALDLEWTRASAPGATIDMTLSPNADVGLYQAIDWIVDHQAANVISMSWGEPDVGKFNSFNTPCSVACNASTDGSYGILSPVLEFAAAEGIGVFAASGDCGASDGTAGLATNYPASDPDVTGVGGTVLTVDASGNYTSEVAWSGNSSGAIAPGCENQGGSGGGYSPFPLPVWQSGLPPGKTHRGVPDVALDAGTPVVVVVGGSTAGVLGTSVGTPIWAGIAAIADQYAGRSLGFLNPALYAIESGPNSSRDLHDILSGSNGYPAGPGWDPVTGLGSPRVASLIVDLAHPRPIAPSSLAVFAYAAPRFGRAPLTVDFAVQATGGSGLYPLEGVSFGDGNASFAPDGNTSYTFTFPGVYSIQAYVADSRGNFSLSPPLAVVVGGGNVLAVNLSSSNSTPAVGGAVRLSAHVTGGTPPYSFDYSFGDGTFLDNSSATNVTHVYGAAGSFCPAVVVSDSGHPRNGAASPRVAIGAGGRPLPDCRNDTVPLSIVPVAGVGPRDAPADFPSLFTISGGPAYPDAVPPSLQFSSTDPYLSACECAIFRAPGSYPVVGWANDSESEQANASTSVTVSPPLVGNFSASPTFGAAPLTVEFRANASGGYGTNAADTVWTFGDGRNASGSAVSETYATPGTYLAIGHLSDRGDGNVSEAFLIAVGPANTVGSPSGVLLTATVAPAVDVAWGASVNFSARVVTGTGSPIPALFHWEVGTSSGSYRPSFNWTYPYGTTGSGLTVNLSAALDTTGQRVNATIALPSFNGGLALGLVRAVDALRFVVPTRPDYEPVDLNWSATPSLLEGPGTLSVSWEFGDGTSLTDPSAQHAFTAGGLRTVVATASDSWGDVANDVFAVAVQAPPGLDASLSATTGTPPFNLSFVASAMGGVGPPYWYSWSFGDGGTATGAKGTHTFTGVGTFLVSVTVTDARGFVAEQNWTVTVERSFALIGVAILGTGAVAGAGAALAVVRLGRRRPLGGSTTPSPPRGGPAEPPGG
ncbi:MAG TPA: PKD domain-containing protein [Thermoplasmata archaeon]|nr:PKD domain-containing protein [Thermoplasmata archaeon]